MSKDSSGYRLTFRSPIALRLIGYGFVGEALTFCAVILLFSGTNGPPLEAFVLLIPFLAIGGLMVLTGLWLRVEITDQGIQIFNRVNTCTFRADWGDVESYRRDKVPFSSRREWIIRCGNQAEQMPLVEDWPELQRQVLTHVQNPKSNLIERDEMVVTPIEGNFKGSRERAIVFGTLGLATVLALLAIVPAVLTAVGPRPEQLPMAFFFSLMIGLFGLYPLSNLRWLPRYFGGKFHADAKGLTAFDGRKEIQIHWSDLILVERFERSRQEGSRGCLGLVSRSAALEIPESTDAYEALKGLAQQVAPPECRIEVD